MSASDQHSDTDVDAAIAMSEHAPTMTTRHRRPWFRHHRRLRRRHSDSALEGVSASNIENSEEQFTQNGAQEGLLEGLNVEDHLRRNHRVHRVTAAVAVFGHILSQVIFRLLIRLCLIKP
jgi:thioredoxin reductase